MLFINLPSTKTLPDKSMCRNESNDIQYIKVYSSGDLFVLNNNRISKYSEEGELTLIIKTPKAFPPLHIDLSGNVLVLGKFINNILKIHNIAAVTERSILIRDKLLKDFYELFKESNNNAKDYLVINVGTRTFSINNNFSSARCAKLFNCAK